MFCRCWWEISFFFWGKNQIKIFDTTFLLSLVKNKWFNLQPENGGSVSRFSQRRVVFSRNVCHQSMGYLPESIQNLGNLWKPAKIAWIHFFSFSRRKTKIEKWQPFVTSCCSDMKNIFKNHRTAIKAKRRTDFFLSMLRSGENFAIKIRSCEIKCQHPIDGENVCLVVWEKF